jgi:hypothetical protein
MPIGFVAVRDCVGRSGVVAPVAASVTGVAVGGGTAPTGVVVRPGNGTGVATTGVPAAGVVRMGPDGRRAASGGSTPFGVGVRG